MLTLAFLDVSELLYLQFAFDVEFRNQRLSTLKAMPATYLGYSFQSRQDRRYSPTARRKVSFGIYYQN